MAPFVLGYVLSFKVFVKYFPGCTMGISSTFCIPVGELFIMFYELWNFALRWVVYFN
jgi:hypothetical protein